MKRISTLFCIALLFSCNSGTKEPNKPQIEKAELDVAKELAAIETLRASFQQAIKEKRFQDLAPMATKDFKGWPLQVKNGRNIED